jgi:hypothetical protein
MITTYPHLGAIIHTSVPRLKPTPDTVLKTAPMSCEIRLYPTKLQKPRWRIFAGGLSSSLYSLEHNLLGRIGQGIKAHVQIGIPLSDAVGHFDVVLEQDAN